MKSAPKAAFVTRLRSRRLTGQTARQLRGQSTIPWVEFSSTGETRLSGAHCIFKQEICNKPRPLNGLVERVFGLLRWHGRAFRLVMLQLPVTSPVHTLVGKIDRRPIGSFSYEKRLKRGGNRGLRSAGIYVKDLTGLRGTRARALRQDSLIPQPWKPPRENGSACHRGPRPVSGSTDPQAVTNVPSSNNRSRAIAGARSITSLPALQPSP
jgi:hypothetical protein